MHATNPKISLFQMKCMGHQNALQDLASSYEQSFLRSEKKNVMHSIYCEIFFLYILIDLTQKMCYKGI